MYYGTLPMCHGTCTMVYFLMVYRVSIVHTYTSMNYCLFSMCYKNHKPYFNSLIKCHNYDCCSSSEDMRCQYVFRGEII